MESANAKSVISDLRSNTGDELSQHIAAAIDSLTSEMASIDAEIISLQNSVAAEKARLDAEERQKKVDDAAEKKEEEKNRNLTKNG